MQAARPLLLAGTAALLALAATAPAAATVTVGASVTTTLVDGLSPSGNCIRNYVSYAISGYGYFRVDVWIENHITGPATVYGHWTSGVLFLTGGASNSGVLTYTHCGTATGTASHGHTYADAVVTSCLTSSCGEPSSHSGGAAESHGFCHWGHTGAC